MLVVREVCIACWSPVSSFTFGLGILRSTAVLETSCSQIVSAKESWNWRREKNKTKHLSVMAGESWLESQAERSMLLDTCVLQ